MSFDYTKHSVAADDGTPFQIEMYWLTDWHALTGKENGRPWSFSTFPESLLAQIFPHHLLVSPVWPEKNRQMLPKNDFTRNMIFNTF